MNKQHIYKSILPELKKISNWSKNPQPDINFDLEYCYQKVFQEDGISSDFGILGLILYLSDSLQDCIEHNISDIGIEYPVALGVSRS